MGGTRSRARAAAPRSRAAFVTTTRSWRRPARRRCSGSPARAPSIRRSWPDGSRCRFQSRLSHKPTGPTTSYRSATSSRSRAETSRSRRARFGRLRHSHGVGKIRPCHFRITALLCATASILSDESLALARLLTLPTFETAGMRLYRRLTIVIADARIEHVFYPVFPSDRHAAEVLVWLVSNPR